MRQFHVVLQSTSLLWKLANGIVPALEQFAFPLVNRGDRFERIARLTYCANHLRTKSKRWIADFEFIGALTEYYDPGIATHWLGKHLQGSACKALLCWSKKALDNSKLILGAQLPVEKCHILYPATGFIGTERTREFDGILRICHITTHRNAQRENLSNFYVKGTRDIFLLLKLISRESPRLLKNFVIRIRGWCPQSYVEKLRSWGVNIENIEQTMTRPEALELIASSDLMLMPCHATPTMAFVEAMSRGVPVVTNDVWANEEYVLSDQTGLLVRPPSEVQYFDRYLTPRWNRPGFTHSLKAFVNENYLRRYSSAISYLLEDEDALRTLQERTIQHFPNSPFDARRRNRELGRLLDGIIG